MPSYIATHRADSSRYVAALVNLAEALLDRPISGGVTIRNVAVVPRTGCLHVHAEAPSPLLVSRLFAACGLVPVSVTPADRAAWARLVGSPTAGYQGQYPDGIAIESGVVSMLAV